MKNLLFIALTCSIFSFLLFGCGNSRLAKTTSCPFQGVERVTINLTRTISPELTISQLFTPTLEPTKSSLPYSSFDQFIRNCPRFEQRLQTGFLTAGTLILRKIKGLGSADVLTLSSQEQSPHVSSFPNTEMWVSPAGKWLALINNGLEIISLDGRTHLSVPWQNQWFSIQGWLDPDHLIFQYRNMAKVDVLDVLTGNIQTFTPDLPDVFVYTDWESRLPAWKLVPDSTLTRFAYMRDLGDAIPDLVIVDLSTRKTLGELRRFTPGESAIPPVWSPDGQWLTVASNDYFTVTNEEIYHVDEEATHLELFMINRDGSSTEWINIKVPSEQTPWFNREMKWSPDGRYLAFFQNSLYLLDMASKTVSDLCVDYPTHVYWSPDSIQIIVEGDGSPPIVIDLDKNKSMQLTDDLNTRIIGWLSEK